MITLHHRATWHGPNPFCAEPVIVVDLAIDEHNLDLLQAACAALQVLCADWYQPTYLADDISVQAASADLASREESEARRIWGDQQVGAFLADWALQALTYVRGYLRGAGCLPSSHIGSVRLWLGFHQASLSMAALQFGADWLNKLAKGGAQTMDFAQELGNLWQACRKRHPDYQARILMEAARALDVPWAPAWGLQRHWRFGQGARSRVFMESSSCDDGALSSRVSGSKAMTKTVLRDLGLPTPTSRLVMRENELAEAVEQVGLPCVIKPIDGSQGKGVNTDLRSLAAAREGFRMARSLSRGPILVEAFIPGNDYRLMVVEGQLKAVIRRDPPHVIGDGVSTVAQLVEQKNCGRDIRSPVRSQYRWPISLDASASLYLAGQGLEPNSVLAPGQRVFVRSNGNLSTGGDCTDVSDRVHPYIRLMVETLASTLNLHIMGADYQTTDIAQMPGSVPGGFIEINTTPGLSALTAAGWEAARAGALVLGDQPGRIATSLLLVPAAELDACEQALAGTTWPERSGWASARRAALGGLELQVKTNANTAPCAALMSHRTLERAFVVYTDQQLMQSGLPLDFFDMAFVCEGLLPESWLQMVYRHSAGCELVVGNNLPRWIKAGH